MKIDENITEDEAIAALRKKYEKAIKAQKKRDREWRELTMLLAPHVKYAGEVVDEVMLNYYSFDYILGEILKAESEKA